MLIEAKGPTAVIPMDEYERLKKIEDKYQDAIEALRQEYENKYKDGIDRLLDDPMYKVVYFKVNNKPNGYNIDYIAQRMTNENYEMLLRKHPIISEDIRVLDKPQFASLIERVFSNPFKK